MKTRTSASRMIYLLVFTVMLFSVIFVMSDTVNAGVDSSTVVVVRQGFNDRIVVVERPIFIGEDDFFFGEEEEGFFFREEERPFFRREIGERRFFGEERDD